MPLTDLLDSDKGLFVFFGVVFCAAVLAQKFLDMWGSHFGARRRPENLKIKVEIEALCREKNIAIPPELQGT